MNIDINNIDPKLLEEDDRIVSFLKGEMSSEEEKLFLMELENNPEFKEKSVITARLVKGLKEVGAKKDQKIRDAFLASSEQAVEAALQKAKTTSNKAAAISIKKVSTWLSIAASIFFIIWLGLDYSSYRSTTGLGAEYDNVFSSSMIARGSDSPNKAEKKLQMIFTNVKKNENIENAIHELSLCWELSRMDSYNGYTNYSVEIGWNPF